jgi:hypothetical protein
LIVGHIDPYFDEDLHQKLLDEYSVDKIDKLVQNRVKFLSNRNRTKKSKGMDKE